MAITFVGGAASDDATNGATTADIDVSGLSLDADDLIILLAGDYNGVGPKASTGFTSLTTLAPGNSSGWYSTVLYKFASGSETTITVTSAGSGNWSPVVAVFRGVRTDQAPAVGTWQQQGSGPDLVIPAVTTPEANCFVVAATNCFGGSTTPSGWTEAINTPGGGVSSDLAGKNGVYYDEFVSAGSTGTLTVSQSGGGWMQGVLLTLEPADAGGGDTNANAGHASATGASNAATGRVSTPSGHASATGASQSPTPRVQPTAGHASATGTAQTPTATVSTPAGHASGTGTAGDATATVGAAAPAGHAAATGAAHDPTATRTGNGNAGHATGTGTAHTPSTSVAVPAGHAAATGSASQPTTTISTPAGHASGTGAANDGTASTGSLTNASAGHASGTAGAHTPTPAIASTAGHAAGTGAALDPSMALAAAAAIATATAIAYTIAAAIQARAGHASATGTAYAADAGGVPDFHPVTLTIRDRGHTHSHRDTGHQVTLRDRGHTTTAREQN